MVETHKHEKKTTALRCSCQEKLQPQKQECEKEIS